MNDVSASQPARNWANISIVWLNEGKWLGGTFAFRDQESVDDFIGILDAIKQQGQFIDDLAVPPPSAEGD